MISSGHVYILALSASPHAIASAANAIGRRGADTLMATATAASMQAKASLPARTTSVSHVGSDTRIAAPRIPIAPSQRRPISAVARTVMSAKRSDNARHIRSSKIALRNGTKGAASE